MRNKDSTETVVTTTCRSHCGSSCILNLYVKDGVITRIETDNGDEPQHRACLRGRAYRQRVYSPDRLLYPLRRIGERGEGKFERISWDEALETVASHIQRINNTYGPESIILLCSGGDIHWLHNGGLIEKVLVRAGGYSGVLGTVSYMGAWFAGMATYNAHVENLDNSRDDFLNSRLIILWGCNPAITRGYGDVTWYLAQAKEAGSRIVVVDPRYTDSAAAFADEWIPVRPGTDAAMLIAMAYVMITEKLHDQVFIDRYTIGFELFKNYVLGVEDDIPKTPAWAEEITGVPADTIISLARQYAANKPVALVDGFGPGRTAYGEQFHRAVATLAAMTGNVGILGGYAGCGCIGTAHPSVQLGPVVCVRMKGGDNPIDAAFPDRSDSVFYQRKDSRGHYTSPLYYFGGPSSSRLNRLRVADAILEGRSGGYPADYKMMYLVNINYVNQYANTNKIIEALKHLEFIVVQEQFMTPTARFADIVLPTNTYMERNDLTTGGLSPFYAYVNQAIESIGESKSHFEIATGLAEKLGIHDYSDLTEEQWLMEIVDKNVDIEDYDNFKKNGIQKVRPEKPHIVFENQIKDPAHNPFPTPSGKIEIYSRDVADLADPMVPPIPKYIEPWEGPNDPLAQKYPLQLITSHPKRRAHTQFDNIPWLKELYPQAVEINAEDARARGISDGDMVQVFNDRGQMIIPARVTGRIMNGVVDIPQGAWYDPTENGIDRGGCANVLTSDDISPGGGAFCSNTALVQVEKAQS